jgi:hypothetical protein
MTHLENHQKEKKIIDIRQAHKVSLTIFGIAAVVFGVPFWLIWQPVFSWSAFAFGAMLFVPIVLVGIVLHELIHGICFGLSAKNGFRSIRFGVLWHYFAPYCHCKEPLKIKHYFIGALMPALVLGLVPAVISLFNGCVLCLIFGVLFIAAATGDFMVVWILRKENLNSYVQDHPSEAGCYVFRD